MDNINDLTNNLKDSVDRVKNASEARKEYAKKIIDGIMTSPKGRLYIKNVPEYQEYLTLRKDPSREDAKYEFCVVSAMKNPDTGFTEGREYNFLDPASFIETVDENRAILDSELVNADNYQRVKESGLNTDASKETESESQKAKREMKERIGQMKTVPDYKKQRVYDVLDAIENHGKVKASEQGDVYEHLALRKMDGLYRYCISKKVVDSYSGATMVRDYIPLNSKTLVAYVEENRKVIDKEVKRLQALDAR